MDTAEPEYTGAIFLSLVLLLVSGRSVVLGADSVYQNVDESTPDWAGTGTEQLVWLQEWGSGEVGLGILQECVCSKRVDSGPVYSKHDF